MGLASSAAHRISPLSAQRFIRSPADVIVSLELAFRCRHRSSPLTVPLKGDLSSAPLQKGSLKLASFDGPSILAPATETRTMGSSPTAAARHPCKPPTPVV